MPSQKNSRRLRAGKGDLRELRRLLIRLGHTEQTNPFPPTSLWQAARAGNIDAARVFLRRGESPSGAGDSPLYQAACKGNLAMVNLLLDHGAAVQPKRSVSSPLQSAAGHGHLEVVKRLLPLCDGAKEEWAIYEAARLGQLECLKALWSGGVSRVNAGFALLNAVEEGFFDCIKFLVDSGVDPRRHPNYSDKIRTRKTTPLQLAETKRRPHIVDLLKGKRVNEQLARASQERTIRARKAAENSSAHMNWARRRERPSFTPEQRPTAIARALDIISSHRKQLKAESGLLELSAKTGETGLVEAMLQSGAKPDASTLWAAVEQGFREIARLLLKSAPPVDKRPFLIAAAKRDDPELVRMLLRAGADAKSKDQFGQTALKFADGVHGPEIRQLLEAKLAAGGKAADHTGLEIKKGKGPFITDSISGLRCFRGSSPNREWIIVFVRAPIETVAQALVRQHKAPRWEKDCAQKAIRPASAGLFLYQLASNEWCVLALSFDWGTEFEKASGDARALSKELSTEVVNYGAEDTAGVEGYELFRSGEKIESASFDGAKISFDSASRRKASFGEPFPEPRFSELGIIPVPFWISDDGMSVSLLLGNVREDFVSRVDFIAFKE